MKLRRKQTVKPDYYPTDEQLERERKELELKADAKAKKLLGFNPFAIGKELEQWQKGCAWHGVPVLKRKLRRAGFNLPMLICHLEAMTKRLKSNV